ncbi:MAG: flavodoxin family protein [Bacillota bacterium]|jgi:multimeric flavodoxin WrbA
MKVVLICGSPRVNGNTAQTLAICAQEIEKAGLETKIINLADKKIESCIACGSCKQKVGRCALNDGVNEIIEEIASADGLIIGSPVYFGTARGDVMSLLQRVGMVSRSGNKFLQGMVGGPIAIARRGGATVSLQEMLMVFFINGMILTGSDYWNILFGGPAGSVLEDKEGIDNIKVYANNVANLIKKVR